jgi:hypothetical protein
MSDLLALLNHAAGCLPEGVQIRITVERGAGWLDLLRDGEEVEFPRDNDGLVEDYLAALKYLGCPAMRPEIALPNGNFVHPERIGLISLYPREYQLPDRIYVSIRGGDTQRIDCESPEEARRVRDEISAQINEAMTKDGPA